jgi:3-oxoacyl-[acyl-carrier-protein] synthase III
MNVVLRGTGSYAPERVITNLNLAARIETSDEWIRSRTGIQERRYAADHETSASMGFEAARQALQAANRTAQDVDMIICATVTPDLMSPSTACIISGQLGCRTVPAFDLSAACSGFVYAMSVADQFLRSGSLKTILVIGSDLLSRVTDPIDRNTCILFGDAAGAIVLEATPEDGPGIHNIRLFADGSGHELIQLPSMMTKHQLADVGFLRMNGREVFKFAVHRLVELFQQAVWDSDQLGRPLSWIVPHQVNIRIIDAALESMNFPRDRVIINLDRYGNTSAASVPLALNEGVRDGRLKPGDTILLAAFGGGLTWSSALMTL